MRKPKVIMSCVANHYAGAAERIIEFSDGKGNGGLISFANHEDGSMTVDVYRHGPRVEVRIGKPDKSPNNSTRERSEHGMYCSDR